MGNKAFKLKAFADDLVITTENLVVCLPRVLEMINEFGQVAGFKLNKNKTKLLMKNTTEQNKNELQKVTEMVIIIKRSNIWEFG